MTTPTARTDGGPAANGSGKITRDAVLAAALEIVDRDSADALSMRRLARTLGRDPMILYRHAPNKAPCSTASPRPSWPSSTSIAPTRTGPASCGRPPAASARWRWPTRTPCR